MSIKGGSYARFRRALESGNLTAVRLAALELPYVDLADALSVCVLMSRQGDPKLSARRFGCSRGSHLSGLG